jgi:hypothetical protein
MREMIRARSRHVECIDPRAMSRREHMALRGFGVLLLAIAALWPRSRTTSHDPAVARHAVRIQYATAAARPSADDLPRPRNVRLVVEDTDESQLRD